MPIRMGLGILVVMWSKLKALKDWCHFILSVIDLHLNVEFLM